ncbi:hypothetical protein AD428_18430 [Achromobacter sp. DMS1]|uniref:hypothetical protein n=1 Tax=Achromobacter sp. DMS1 TaxID=1688405 RepID=UPI00069EDEB0|nr:hypothetical protein [Achromobacter sp. DMS1]KOF52709.1 hypothetical protein AD428_18430 [Achromobacter sp. DMS1]
MFAGVQAGGVQQYQPVAQAHALQPPGGFGGAFPQGRFAVANAIGADVEEADLPPVGPVALREEVAQGALAGIELAEHQQHDLAGAGLG